MVTICLSLVQRRSVTFTIAESADNNSSCSEIQAAAAFGSVKYLAYRTACLNRMKSRSGVPASLNRLSYCQLCIAQHRQYASLSTNTHWRSTAHQQSEDFTLLSLCHQLHSTDYRQCNSDALQHAGIHVKASSQYVGALYWCLSLRVLVIKHEKSKVTNSRYHM
jgi:hypothetical protein